MRAAARAVTLAALAAACSGVHVHVLLPSSAHYCIIGAGPGAVQIGHYMLRAAMDYHIIERSGACVAPLLPWCDRCTAPPLASVLSH